MSNTLSKKLLRERRRREMADRIHQEGTISSEDLALEFNVSLMTIWRDLKALEDRDMIQRVHGGAAALNNATIEPLYTKKQSINRRLKEQIARYACEHFINAGDIIVLEAGTTAMAMVKHITQKKLTVITNGLGTLNELAKLQPDIETMCCGGILRDLGNTFVGPQAEEFFNNTYTNTLFLSATGITIEHGVSDPNVMEIQVKRAMASNADKVIMLLDSSKFGVRSLQNILAIEQITAIVTDSLPEQVYVDWLKEYEVELHVCS